jgi:hypothetical protein
MDMDLTSVDGLYGRMDMDIGRANPIRKDVAANWPNWLPEGVVGCHPLHSYCCRSSSPRGCCSLSSSLAVAITYSLDIRPDFCQCLRHSICSIIAPSSRALVYGIVLLAALNTRSDTALIATTKSVSIAILDSCRYDVLCCRCSRQ